MRLKSVYRKGTTSRRREEKEENDGHSGRNAEPDSLLSLFHRASRHPDPEASEQSKGSLACISALLMGSVVLRVFQVKDGHQMPIVQARTDSRIGGTQSLWVRRDHGRQTGVIAMIEQLKQLFVGPRGVLLRSQVI